MVYSTLHKLYQIKLQIKYISDFDEEKFFKYWARIENKFECAGICRIGYNETSINKFLFTDSTKTVKKNGCIYPLSNWLNKMIISFGSLLIINIVISTLCLYICFVILFVKVYEESNLPKSFMSKDKFPSIIPGEKDFKELKDFKDLKEFKDFKDFSSVDVKISNDNNSNKTK